MIFDDFKDIRSRMLGDDKPKPKAVEKPKCTFCTNGWVAVCVNCAFCNPERLPHV